MEGANKTCVSDSSHAAAMAEFRLLTSHDCLWAHLYRFNLTESLFVCFWTSHGRLSSLHLRVCEERLESSWSNDLMVNDQAFDK
ncbi:hypothetical protein TNCV_3828261 [Trichonephila clavipes]|nr:hypothetical protein TNCV_3828261 [Trichonephila clavipes]